MPMVENVSLLWWFYCCIDDRNRHDEEDCNVASALLQFFEMASEMWFLCLSVDIFISVTNPLASFKKRYYGTFRTFPLLVNIIVY